MGLKHFPLADENKGNWCVLHYLCDFSPLILKSDAVECVTVDTVNGNLALIELVFSDKGLNEIKLRDPIFDLSKGLKHVSVEA